jgi:antitoxin component of RelBE/YafQ-DinJ toxin-antitoxin module
MSTFGGMNNRMKIVTFRLTQAEHTALQDVCRRMGTSLSELIRLAVLEAIDDNPRKRTEAKLDRILTLLEARSEP